MNAVVSIVLLAAVLGVIVFASLPARRTPAAASTAPPACREFRTDLAAGRVLRPAGRPQRVRRVRLRVPPRERDGGFLLHLTLHQPTQQPLDTLYTLRLDPGRQTVVTLIFIRESFGYKEPLFPQEMLDDLYDAEAPGPPHQIIFARKDAFHLPQFFAILSNAPCLLAGCLCGLVAQLVRAGGS